jgi:hypothetical protein
LKQEQMKMSEVSKVVSVTSGSICSHSRRRLVPMDESSVWEIKTN